MRHERTRQLTFLLPLMTVWACLPEAAVLAEGVSFRREILPILSQKCFACHGPDDEHRQADLRLDEREAAIDFGALIPGSPEDSEIIRRVLSDDDSERMPPPQAHDTLTEQEKDLLQRWVAEGAEYVPHWAFVAPERPELPQVKDANWPATPIDQFILEKIEAAGTAPLAPADRYDLIRRVTLDLVGLLPSPEEADDFALSQDPLAYEKLVDRLLASPAYGERWGRVWLDLARYADSNGYEKDRPRSIWPYRDWVIRSINADMPYDQFSIEQLAGDMLPGATLDQRVATGFNRNTMLNEEGGIDPLEYRHYAMLDRVATTGIVWMGLTTGCAQCHTHKYDPITHTEYHALMALLNNADEPDLIVPNEEIAERQAKLESQIAELESKLPGQFPPEEAEGAEEARRAKNLEKHFLAWIEKEQAAAADWQTLRPSHMDTNLPRLELLEDGSIFSSGDITKRDVYQLTFPLDGLSSPITALRLEALPDDRLPAKGPGRAYYEGRKGDFFLSELTAEANGQPATFDKASHSYGKIAMGFGNANAANVIDADGSTGWSVAEQEGAPHQIVLHFKTPLAPVGDLKIEMLFERHFAASLGRFRIAATSKTGEVNAKPYPVETEQLLVQGLSACSQVEKAELMTTYLRLAPELAEARKQIDELRKKIPDDAVTLVMQERPADYPRETHLYHRGEYLSPKEVVAPGVPAIFQGLPDDEPADRLTFARWLVSERNPLVARVAVDRAWQAFFGYGLVRTSGDYGTQSDPPTHPELLDWLACELVEQGWSLKHLHRLIVTSNVYQQTSHCEPERRQQDPENRLFARGPRHRVDAEIVRDLMLDASGLLSGKTYGPSVYPPQPGSVSNLAYGFSSWPESKGEDRYRRSLYTFRKRTTPFAAYAAFDGPTGEVCIANRDRSNTPLQALTLLNDKMFLEMAQALAAQAMSLPDTADEDRLAYVFRKLLVRPPEENERAAIEEYYLAQRARFESGELKPDAITGRENSTPQAAALTFVARALMNLDETIAKP